MSLCLERQIKLVLSNEAFALLKARADGLGLAPTTMARMIVVSSLNQISEETYAERPTQGTGRTAHSPSRGSHVLRKNIPKKRA
jgi:hypothetical protein